MIVVIGKKKKRKKENPPKNHPPNLEMLGHMAGGESGKKEKKSTV